MTRNSGFAGPSLLAVPLVTWSAARPHSGHCGDIPPADLDTAAPRRDRADIHPQTWSMSWVRRCAFPRQKITVSGRATYDTPRREGEGHGDLVMALALALAVPNTLRKPDLIDRE